MALGVVVVDALVDLPQVQVVGSQPPQRLVELAHRDPRVAAVRADLRHQEHRVAAIGNRASHPLFALAPVIFPGIVEEVNAGVYCFVHDAHGFGAVFRVAEVVAAESDDGDAIGMLPEGPRRHGIVGGFS